MTTARLKAIERERFRRALNECRFGLGPGQRPGFVPFNARVLLTRLAREQGLTPRRVALSLARWARELGGELVEGEVLWLPENVVRDLRLEQTRHILDSR